MSTRTSTAPPAVMICKTDPMIVIYIVDVYHCRLTYTFRQRVCSAFTNIKTGFSPPSTGENGGTASKASHQGIEAATSRLLSMGADWIEHALEIRGVPYLRTPEEELSWIVLNNLDVYAAFAAAAAAALLGLALGVRQVRRSFMQAHSATASSSKKPL